SQPVGTVQATPAAWVGALPNSDGEPGAVGNTGCCWGAGFSATGALAPCLHAVRLARVASSTKVSTHEIYLILVLINLMIIARQTLLWDPKGNTHPPRCGARDRAGGNPAPAALPAARVAVR